GKTARRHLLGVAHELVEMNLGRSDERADATAAFHEALAFEESEGVARSHEADAMRAREVALGRDTIAGLKLAGIDALAKEAWNGWLGRQRVRVGGGGCCGRTGRET